MKRNWIRAAALTCLALAGVAACGDDVTGPLATGEPIQLSREITLGELEAVLQSGTVRLEVELLPQEPIARRVEVRLAEAQSEDEAIAGHVATVTASENGGVVSLLLDGIDITFSAETALRGPGGDELGITEFAERVQGALNDGLEPALIAWRAPPDVPQDPDLNLFLATEIRLLEESEGWLLSVNADADNVELNTSGQDGQPDGWVHLLGQAVQLRVSDGVTEIVTEEMGVDDAVEFEGHVSSVNLEAETFTFSDGTLVRITELTQILEADVDQPLLTLQQVHAALGEGLDVVAWGGGTLESKEPRILEALELRFAVAGGESDDILEFEGFVSQVDVGTSTFTLKNGTVVSITDPSVVMTTGEGELLANLEQVAAALGDGKHVLAYGAAQVAGHEPLTLIALEMRFLVTVPKVEFEGMVATADPAAGTFTLTDGTIVRVVPGVTQIKEAEGGHSLPSLQAVADALDVGDDVVAWGHGEVESEEPLRVVALAVYFVLSQ